MNTPRQSFAPVNRQGALLPAAGAGVAALLALLLVLRASGEGISFAGFILVLAALLLLAVGAVLAYWAWASALLRYELGEGVLRVHWGLSRHAYAARDFERVARGRAGAAPPVDGLDWPGLHIGWARLPRVGRVLTFSLHRTPADLLYLLGPEQRLALAPRDREAFVAALHDQQALAPAGSEEREPLPLALLLRLAPALDPLLGPALLAGAALALLATGIVFSRYAGLADTVVLHFPERARLGGRAGVLGIPALAWGVLALNAALALALARTYRPVAVTLLAAAAFLTGLLCVAAVAAV